MQLPVFLRTAKGEGYGIWDYRWRMFPCHDTMHTGFLSKMPSGLMWKALHLSSPWTSALCRSLLMRWIVGSTQQARALYLLSVKRWKPIDCTRSVLSVEGDLVLCHLWFLFCLLPNLLLVLLMTGRLGIDGSFPT
jgi:hypothetical protein